MLLSDLEKNLENTANELNKDPNRHLKTIEVYTNEVCNQINWKKSHDLVKTELTNHILDQRFIYLTEGDSDETATKEAISQMGDAVLVGTELNAIHKPRHQWIVIAIISILFALGVYIQKDIALFFAPHIDINLQHYAVGYVVFMLCYFLDFTLLGRYAKYIALILTTISVSLAFFSKNPTYINFITSDFFNSYAMWIYPFIFSIFVYARIKKGYYGVFLCFLQFLILFLTLVTITSNTATAVVFTISSFFIISFAIIKNWFGRTVTFNINKILIFFIIISAIGFIPFLINPFAIEKYLYAFNAEGLTTADGFLYLKIKDIIANAHFFNPSTVKSSYEEILLPNEFILTHLVYEYGLIFIPIVIIPVIYFLGISFSQWRKQKSFLGSLIIFSICVPIILNCTLFVFHNLGIMLVKSYYPFISLEYSGHIVIAGLMGFVASVFRIGYVVND